MTQTTHFTAGLDAHLHVTEALPTRYISAAEMAYHRNRAHNLRAEAVDGLFRGVARALRNAWTAPAALPRPGIGGKLLVTAE